VEPAFLEDADGSDVVFRDVGIQRARLDVTQKLRQRPGSDSPAPEALADPVTDERSARLLEAHDVSGHLSVEKDRLLRDGRVGQDLRPVSHECFPVPGRERGHPDRVPVELLFEEDGEVALRDVAQPDVVGHTVVPAIV
jgi:hypothetical protein